MPFELTATPPPAVYGIGGNREYTRYDEQAAALRANPGYWLKLSTVEISPKTVDGVTESAADAEKEARKRAGNRVSMIRQGKGSWAGAEWATVIAQPAGPGTSFEVHVSFVRELEIPTKDETPSQNGHADVTPTTDASDAAAELSTEAGVQADATVSDATPEGTEDVPTPRARRKS